MIHVLRQNFPSLVNGDVIFIASHQRWNRVWPFDPWPDPVSELNILKIGLWLHSTGISTVADGPARRATSRVLCCTQRWQLTNYPKSSMVERSLSHILSTSFDQRTKLTDNTLQRSSWNDPSAQSGTKFQGKYYYWYCPVRIQYVDQGLWKGPSVSSFHSNSSVRAVDIHR